MIGKVLGFFRPKIYSVLQSTGTISFNCYYVIKEPIQISRCHLGQISSFSMLNLFANAEIDIPENKSFICKPNRFGNLTMFFKWETYRRIPSYKLRVWWTTETWLQTKTYWIRTKDIRACDPTNHRSPL